MVWLDALTSNVDRGPRNPNLLVWHRRLWLIDHGAALVAHHGDWTLEGAWARPVPAIREHVLLPVAGSIAEADARLTPVLGRGALERIAGDIPDAWLRDEPDPPDPAARRAAYVAHLERRLAGPRAWAAEAEEARRAA